MDERMDGWIDGWLVVMGPFFLRGAELSVQDGPSEADILHHVLCMLFLLLLFLFLLLLLFLLLQYSVCFSKTKQPAKLTRDRAVCLPIHDDRRKRSHPSYTFQGRAINIVAAAVA